jgi:hypothetical protein
MGKQNLTEEIYRMRKLMNFDSKEFNENTTSEDNLIEENYINNFINEQEVSVQEDNGDEPEKGGFSIGINKKGGRNSILSKMRGVDSRGAMGGLSVSWDKESNKKLDTSQDVLSKMNEELGDSEFWGKLSNTTKESLAEGYYKSIEEGLNKLQDVLSKKEIKYYGLNKLKKFFKKSQRWKFKALSSSDLIKSELTWKIITEGTLDKTSEELNKEFSSLINGINNANSQSNTILSSECNIMTQDKKNAPLTNTTTKKTPLSTVLLYEKTPIVQKKIRSEQTKAFIVGTNISIPPNTEIFDAGKDKISGAINDVVSGIYKKILDSTFEVKVGKEVYTNTGREIVDAGNTLRLDLLRTISSASNTWTNEDVLDITHNNDGTKVKNFDSLETSGNNKRNQKLSKRRNNNLMNAVLSLLGEKQGIVIDDKLRKDYEIRITDTGGKIDEDRDESKYPKPGQYAEFFITIKGDVEYTEYKPNSYKTSGKLGQSGIGLFYEGKPPKGLDINFGLVFGGKTKATIVKARPILTWLENITSGDELKKPSMSLRGGSKLWSNIRNKGWQKKIGNKNTGRKY